jgi:hypothetical protein
MLPECAVEKSGKRWLAGFILGKLPNGQPVIDSWSPAFNDISFRTKGAAVAFVHREMEKALQPARDLFKK